MAAGSAKSLRCSNDVKPLHWSTAWRGPGPGLLSIFLHEPLRVPRVKPIWPHSLLVEDCAGEVGSLKRSTFKFRSAKVPIELVLRRS